MRSILRAAIFRAPLFGAVENAPEFDMAQVRVATGRIGPASPEILSENARHPQSRCHMMFSRNFDGEPYGAFTTVWIADVFVGPDIDRCIVDGPGSRGRAVRSIRRIVAS